MLAPDSQNLSRNHLVILWLPCCLPPCRMPAACHWRLFVAPNCFLKGHISPGVMTDGLTDGGREGGPFALTLLHFALFYFEAHNYFHYFLLIRSLHDWSKAFSATAPRHIFHQVRFPTQCKQNVWSMNWSKKLRPSVGASRWIWSLYYWLRTKEWTTQLKGSLSLIET